MTILLKVEKYNKSNEMVENFMFLPSKLFDKPLLT